MSKELIEKYVAATVLASHISADMQGAGGDVDYTPMVRSLLIDSAHFFSLLQLGSCPKSVLPWRKPFRFDWSRFRFEKTPPRKKWGVLAASHVGVRNENECELIVVTDAGEIISVYATKCGITGRLFAPHTISYYVGNRLDIEGSCLTYQSSRFSLKKKTWNQKDSSVTSEELLDALSSCVELAGKRVGATLPSNFIRELQAL